MSIFKTIGNKLKRVVSIKNLVNGVTGNFSAVASDVKRVMTTPDPKKANVPSANVALSSFEIPKEVNAALDLQGKNLSNSLVSKFAGAKVVQQNVNPLNEFAFKVWFKATWEKYKNWIIGFVFALIFFIVGWRLFKTPKRAKR